MSGPADIRPVQPADIPAITAIYSHYVRTSTASFETVPPGESEMRRRAAEGLDRGLPYLVAEAGGQVAGFAYAVPYRPRAAYVRTLESSVYVAHDAAGRGIGRALMDALIAECRALGAHRLIAVVGGSDNAPSIALHEKLGFRHAGTFTQAGFK
ncbi:MAG: N-acetyltransferase family protein, partial [Alphaproteobacteria bacterium]